jgi:hypothetical protein
MTQRVHPKHEPARRTTWPRPPPRERQGGRTWAPPFCLGVTRIGACRGRPPADTTGKRLPAVSRPAVSSKHFGLVPLCVRCTRVPAEVAGANYWPLMA